MNFPRTNVVYFQSFIRILLIVNFFLRWKTTIQNYFYEHLLILLLSI